MKSQYCRTLASRLSIAAVIGLMASSASAELEVLSGGLAVYDTDRDITWVADANLCVTLGNCVNGNAQGAMRWIDALKWAYELDYLGQRDWRLPTALEFDGSGPNSTQCPSGEMGHLFCVELGGDANISGPFINIQRAECGYASVVRYWSREHIGVNAPAAGWYFDFCTGQQGIEAFGGDDDFLFAWAVRKGKLPAVRPGKGRKP